MTGNALQPSPAWILSRTRRRWLPLVGTRYATEFARDQFGAILASALIYISAAAINVLAVMLAANVRQVWIVECAVAVTIPAAISVSVYWRKTHSPSSDRLSADLWSGGIPVLGTMPVSRVGWASSWMHANGISPQQIESLTAEAPTPLDRGARNSTRPAALKWSVWAVWVGILISVAGAIFAIQDNSRDLDQELIASSSAVFSITLLMLLGSTILTALFWLARSAARGSAAARLTATLVTAVLLCATVVGQLAFHQVWLLLVIGVATCVAGTVLSWTRSGSVFIRNMGDIASDRARRVKFRAAGGTRSQTD